MAFKDDLRTKLLTQSSITTLAPAQAIHGQSYSGIFVDKVKEGFKPPFVVIERTSFSPLVFTNSTPGAGTEELEIACVEYTEPKAETLAAAVSDYLKSLTGTIGSYTGCSVNWRTTTDDKYLEDDGRDVWRHEVVLSFGIFHD